MEKFRRIGILTSGGDAPGMNAAIRAVTREALMHGVEVVGIYRGYSGLIDGDIKTFGLRDVSNIVNHGGTILYSDRCPEFKTEPGIQKAVATCKKFHIDGIVAIGGDGTFRGATDMTLHGIPCVGLPGTIDNDIASTDHSIGFDTAMNTVIEMVDRLRDTCESHARCSVVEVMGRNAGDIALQTGIASGATATIIPEIPFEKTELFEKIHKSKAAGKRNFIVMVSEGMGPDYASTLSTEIEAETGVETRFARLAHVVRGGSPTLRDRVMAAQMGKCAVEELLRGNSNIVICERDNQIVATDIGFALALDHMYKGKLKDGDLDKFTPEQIKEMTALCEKRKKALRDLYALAEDISL